MIIDHKHKHTLSYIKQHWHWSSFIVFICMDYGRNRWNYVRKNIWGWFNGETSNIDANSQEHTMILIGRWPAMESGTPGSHLEPKGDADFFPKWSMCGFTGFKGKWFDQYSVDIGCILYIGKIIIRPRPWSIMPPHTSDWLIQKYLQM